jgi:DnaJ-class molecular chaperone
MRYLDTCHTCHGTGKINKTDRSGNYTDKYEDCHRCEGGKEILTEEGENVVELLKYLEVL